MKEQTRNTQVQRNKKKLKKKEEAYFPLKEGDLAYTTVPCWYNVLVLPLPPIKSFPFA